MRLGEDDDERWIDRDAAACLNLRRIFKPEFLNRIDETIVFRALNKDDMKQIVALMLKELTDLSLIHISERITPSITPARLALIATVGPPDCATIQFFGLIRKLLCV